MTKKLKFDFYFNYEAVIINIWNIVTQSIFLFLYETFTIYLKRYIVSNPDNELNSVVFGKNLLKNVIYFSLTIVYTQF